MKWHECVNENKKFTSPYDQTINEIRKVLGSYERIAQQATVHTGHPISGQSIRRWINNRALPLQWGVTLIEMASDADAEFGRRSLDALLHLYPYTKEIIDNAIFE